MEKIAENLINKISMGSNTISKTPTVIGLYIKA